MAAPTPLAVAAVFSASFFGCFAFSITGVGVGVMVTIIWAFWSSVDVLPSDSVATVSHVWLHIAIACPLQAVLLRRHINLRFSIGVIALWMAMQFVGQEVLYLVAGLWFKRCLGIGLFCILLIQAVVLPACARWQRSRAAAEEAEAAEEGQARADAPSPSAVQGSALGKGAEAPAARPGEGGAAGAAGDLERPADAGPTAAAAAAAADRTPAFDFLSRRNLLFGAALGGLGGFLNGLSGIPLPAYLLFTFGTGVPKDLWRACVAAIGTVSGPLGLYYFLVEKDGYDETQVPLYIASIVANVVALPLGNAVAKYVNQQGFRKALMFFMFVGSMIMMTAGTGVGSLMVITGVAALVVVVGILRHYRQAKLKLQAAEAAQAAN